MAELHEHARNGGETPSELSDLRSIDVRLAGCAPTQNRHTAPTRSSARVTWILTAIVMLVAPAAAADPRPRDRVAVVALDLGPSTPPYLRATATSQIQAALAAAGNEVMPTIEVRARLSGELAGCRKGECVRRVGEALGARSLVFVTIDGKDENLLVAMRLHDGRTGEPEAEVREVCDLCGEAELSERLAIATSALHARALDARERKAKQAAAAAPPAPPAPVPGGGARAGRSRSLVPGILVGAVGAAAIGGGLYLVAIDGRGACDRGDGPVYPDPGAVIRYPDPSNPDRFVCRDVYRTRIPGIASAGVGVAALAAGAALVVRARYGDHPLEVAPLPGGAALQASWSW